MTMEARDEGKYIVFSFVKQIAYDFQKYTKYCFMMSEDFLGIFIIVILIIFCVIEIF